MYRRSQARPLPPLPQSVRAGMRLLEKSLSPTNLSEGSKDTFWFFCPPMKDRTPLLTSKCSAGPAGGKCGVSVLIECGWVSMVVLMVAGGVLWGKTHRQSVTQSGSSTTFAQTDAKTGGSKSSSKSTDRLKSLLFCFRQFCDNEEHRAERFVPWRLYFV